jgi:hypothetical protein
VHFHEHTINLTSEYEKTENVILDFSELRWKGPGRLRKGFLASHQLFLVAPIWEPDCPDAQQIRFRGRPVA